MIKRFATYHVLSHTKTVADPSGKLGSLKWRRELTFSIGSDSILYLIRNASISVSVTTLAEQSALSVGKYIYIYIYIILNYR